MRVTFTIQAKCYYFYCMNLQSNKRMNGSKRYNVHLQNEFSAHHVSTISTVIHSELGSLKFSSHLHRNCPMIELTALKDDSQGETTSSGNFQDSN